VDYGRHLLPLVRAELARRTPVPVAYGLADEVIGGPAGAPESGNPP
jgi:hypothetical protein